MDGFKNVISQYFAHVDYNEDDRNEKEIMSHFTVWLHSYPCIISARFAGIYQTLPGTAGIQISFLSNGILTYMEIDLRLTMPIQCSDIH